jgi:ribosomal protein S14
MNAQSIFVNEAGGNEALGEPNASMRKDEIAWLFLHSENFLREIAACHRGFGPGLQDRRCRRDARPLGLTEAGMLRIARFCFGERPRHLLIHLCAA